MFGLLTSVFGRRAQDPISCPKATRRWLEALPRRDARRAQQMVVAALDRFNAGGGPRGRDRLGVLQCLDQGGGPIQQALCREYLEHPEPGATGALWTGIHAYYRHFSHAYQSFVVDCLAPARQGTLVSDFPTVTARTLHYLGLEVRCRYFRGEGLHAGKWRRLHKLYRIAESAGFASRRVNLANGRDSSCAAEYLAVLVLDLAAPLSLSAAQIERIGSWLPQRVEGLAVDRRADYARHTHCVDLCGEGALRLRGPTGGDDLRYWDMGELLDEIGSLCSAVRGGDPTPPVGTGATTGASLGPDLPERLRAAWVNGVAPEAGTACSAYLAEAARGFDAVLGALRGATGGTTTVAMKSLPGTDDGELRIEGAACAATVGSLLGLRPCAAGGPWRIGVVRWVSSTLPGGLSMGVEQLSDAPRPVRIASEAGNGAAFAIFLPKVDRHGIASSLILPGTLAASGTRLEMWDGEIGYGVRLVSVLERSEGWARVKFNILERKPAGG